MCVKKFTPPHAHRLLLVLIALIETPSGIWAHTNCLVLEPVLALGLVFLNDTLLIESCIRRGSCMERWDRWKKADYGTSPEQDNMQHIAFGSQLAFPY